MTDNTSPNSDRRVLPDLSAPQRPNVMPPDYLEHDDETGIAAMLHAVARDTVRANGIIGQSLPATVALAVAEKLALDDDVTPETVIPDKAERGHVGPTLKSLEAWALDTMDSGLKGAAGEHAIFNPGGGSVGPDARGHKLAQYPSQMASLGVRLGVMLYKDSALPADGGLGLGLRVAYATSKGAVQQLDVVDDTTGEKEAWGDYLDRCRSAKLSRRVICAPDKVLFPVLQTQVKRAAGKVELRDEPNFSDALTALSVKAMRDLVAVYYDGRTRDKYGNLVRKAKGPDEAQPSRLEVIAAAVKDDNDKPLEQRTITTDTTADMIAYVSIFVRNPASVAAIRNNQTLVDLLFGLFGDLEKICGEDGTLKVNLPPANGEQKVA